MSVKRVLVTGSSRGIGRAIALRLASDGWQVVLHCSSNIEDARSVANEIGSSCRGILKQDLSKPGAADALWQQFQSMGGGNAIVNNAGIYQPISMLEASDEEFESNYAQTFAVNFDAPLRLCRLAVREFAAVGGGKILNVASRVGFRGEAGASLYAASKAALINLTRSLAVECSKKNVQLFGIAPGWVETAMARDGMEQRLDQILRDIPLGRMASPEDCANCAAFFLRPESAYLSGMTLDINGASYFH